MKEKNQILLFPLLPILVLICLVVFNITCCNNSDLETAHTHSVVSVELKAMVKEDQEFRMDDSIDYSIINAADLKHRERVFELLAQGVIVDPEDLYLAALLLQHADPSSCRDCYLLAYRLAIEAVNKGFDKARAMSAKNIDRYLVFSNKPQKYGTQYNYDDSTSLYYLFPVDSITTDKERLEWNVKPLDSMQAFINKLNSIQ
ncbi:MAG: hypothetical protein GY865_12270 [candidate division Zixibacteria bacterium]|nr:hypothetical protein [candidate division Zixibacteria bacterium]